LLNELLAERLPWVVLPFDLPLAFEAACFAADAAESNRGAVFSRVEGCVREAVASRVALAPRLLVADCTPGLRVRVSRLGRATVCVGDRTAGLRATDESLAPARAAAVVSRCPTDDEGAVVREAGAAVREAGAAVRGVVTVVRGAEAVERPAGTATVVRGAGVETLVREAGEAAGVAVRVAGA
jgi:hypothetical protein